MGLCEQRMTKRKTIEFFAQITIDRFLVLPASNITCASLQPQSFSILIGSSSKDTKRIREGDSYRFHSIFLRSQESLFP